MEDFIELYEAALPRLVCTELISRFDAHPAVSRGRAGANVDLSVKDSFDLCIDPHPEFAALRPFVGEAALRGLMRYLRRYPMTVLASHRLSRAPHASSASETLDADALAALDDGALRSLAIQFFRIGELNLQRYACGRGGYFAWHSEVSPADPSGEKLHRVLPFMFYLNDVAEGGETEWLHQRRRIAPRAGTLAIWPAYFTHAHRGRTPESGDKYILTSWILFRAMRSGESKD